MRMRLVFSFLALFALAHHTRADEAVKALEKTGAKVTRDLTVPAKPIVGVILSDKATDEHMKLLKGIPGLETVTIPGGEVSDDGLRELLPLKKLKALEVSHLRGVTDAGMGTLAKIPTLERLALNYTLVTDDGMQEVKKLKSLRELSLHGTRVADLGVAFVADMAELRSLDLGGLRVTDHAMESVKKLKKLETLYLTNTDITDAGVKHLKGMESLVSLDLQIHNKGSSLTDDCLAEFAGMKNLKYLALDSSSMTATGLTKLTKMPALEGLHLSVATLLPSGMARVGQTKKELAELRKLFPKTCTVTVDDSPK